MKLSTLQSIGAALEEVRARQINRRDMSYGFDDWIKATDSDLAAVIVEVDALTERLNDWSGWRTETLRLKIDELNAAVDAEKKAQAKVRRYREARFRVGSDPSIAAEAAEQKARGLQADLLTLSVLHDADLHHALTRGRALEGLRAELEAERQVYAERKATMEQVDEGIRRRALAHPALQ